MERDRITRSSASTPGVVRFVELKYEQHRSRRRWISVAAPWTAAAVNDLAHRLAAVDRWSSSIACGRLPEVAGDVGRNRRTAWAPRGTAVRRHQFEGSVTPGGSSTREHGRFGKPRIVPVPAPSFLHRPSVLAVIGMGPSPWSSCPQAVILDPLTATDHAVRASSMGTFRPPSRRCEAGRRLDRLVREVVLALQMREKSSPRRSTDRAGCRPSPPSRPSRRGRPRRLARTMLETVPAALMIFNLDGSVGDDRAATEVMDIEPPNPELRNNYWGQFKRVAKDGTRHSAATSGSRPRAAWRNRQ